MAELARTPFPTAASGHANRYGVMANALFDLDIGSPYIFPYLGVGGGYMWTRLNGSFTEPGGPFQFSTDDTEGRFAVQGIFGLSFPIPHMPGLSITADYRFTDITAGAKFSGTETTAAGTTTGRIKLGAQYDHSFLLGVRYAFYAPPPPMPAAAAPVAAPAPAPARSYLVFFDWDKATLTDRARQIIREAAENSTHVQTTQDRGQRLHRHVRHAAIQHGSFAASGQRSRRRTGARRCPPQRDLHPGLRRDASAGAHRPRRARTSEPPGRDHPALSVETRRRGTGYRADHKAGGSSALVPCLSASVVELSGSPVITSQT